MFSTFPSKIMSAVCLAITLGQVVLSIPMPAYELNVRANVSRSGLEARAGSSSSSLEFIGYTGTIKSQADNYSRGQLVKTASSGAGSVMGDGIYLTDTLQEAVGYANQAAANAAPRGTNVATINSNLPYAPYVCKFYAVKTAWRGNVVKVWFDAANRNAAMYDQEARNTLRLSATATLPPYVRMKQLNINGANQLVLSSGTTSGIQVVCQPAATVTPESKSCDYLSMAKKWNVKGNPPVPRRGVTCAVQ